jgi:protein-L-isoaspartate(D-aspartate) O-methyltransferase
MVESQLRTNQVTDGAVLEAFLAVPRERFVPARMAGVAYTDEKVPLAPGRCLLEPMVMARLLQLLALQPTDRVLAVGTGTGCAAAHLSRLAAKVIALESDGELAATARLRLAELGCGNVTIIEGPLPAGHAAGAPYDAIFIDGAVAAIPDALAAQLGEGGRLATVVKSGVTGQAVLMTRAEGVLSQRPVFDAAPPVLPGFEPAPSFVF